MPRSISLAVLLGLSACTASSEPDKPADATDTAQEDADTGQADATSDREPPVYSQGTCPVLESGRNTEFVHEGGSHDLWIHLPPEPEGAPVLFAWHWLGGTASQLVSAMDLDGLAEREGVIVVAPDSAGSEFEWAFDQIDPEGNPDLALFRDLLSCVHNQWSVDLDRIWTTGMSAGGLWTSYLTMHEGEWLAASAPLSGGTFPGYYWTPESTMPVMVTWGGPSDTYGGGAVNFEELSEDFSQQLQADGHFVVECVHTRGHTLPPDATDLVWGFLSAHTYGEPSPWESGLPSDVPDWCRVATE